MTTRDPLSPQWEDCKVCGGDHWTKDHPDLRLPPEKQGPMNGTPFDPRDAEATLVREPTPKLPWPISANGLDPELRVTELERRVGVLEDILFRALAAAEKGRLAALKAPKP
jgi:hypothetical protein